MRVLVTGGGGFIGKHVVHNLEARGIRPVLFDRRSIEPSGEPYRETLLGNVRDRTAVWQAIEETDAVIHLAGMLGTAEMVDNPMPAIENNILGTMNVFLGIRAFDKPAVYITLGNHFMNNTYSITKSTSERFALMANKEWGTHIAVVRGYNAYGPGQKIAPVKKIIPSMLMSALRDEPISIYGGGDQIADMIYVEDLADILVRALVEEHGIYDSIFEAGTGMPTTVNQVGHAVIKAVEDYRGRPIDSFLSHTEMRAGEPENAVVLGDPNTLKPLGIDPAYLTALMVGVKQTVPAYAEQS